MKVLSSNSQNIQMLSKVADELTRLQEVNKTLLEAVKLAAVMHPHNVTFSLALAKAEKP